MDRAGNALRLADVRLAPQAGDQQQVAEKTGVIWLSVSNWERGIYRPSKRALTGIIAFLGYDPWSIRE
jgi:transcriptional regulator with XRE-family HTH domain